MGRTKDAFYAGFSAGETEDSVDDSWKEYRDAQRAAKAAEEEDGNEGGDE